MIKAVGAWLLLALFPFSLRFWSQEAAGNRAFRRGDYTRAVERYRTALGRTAEDAPRLRYNLGTALLWEGDPEAAREQLTAALEAQSPELRARAFYNLGNVHVQDRAVDEVQRLLDAIAAYRRALLLNPDDEDARWNLELAMRRLEEDPSQALTSPEQTPTPTAPQPESGEGMRPEQGVGQAPAQQPGVAPPAESAAPDQIDAPLPRELAEQILRAVEERERGLQRDKLRRRRQRVSGPDW